MTVIDTTPSISDLIDAIRADPTLEIHEPFPVGPTEIAEILGITRNRVYQLRGKLNFPKAKWELAMGDLWDLRDILTYKRIPRVNGRPPIGE